MRKIIFLSFLFISFLASAHPGIGIVKDSKGNIYYTDLAQIWRVTPDGNKKIVVPGVHSHELYMDASDNLYGEHLWYNGEKQNTWGFYVWCLKNTGELIKVKGPTGGFLSDYSFVRDSSGNMYWVERFTRTRFMKKTPDGTTSKLAEAKLGFIGWLYCTPGGILYFAEKDKLRKITPEGKIILLADDLGSKTTDFTFAGRNYDGYGIWTDSTDNIYIAMIDAKKVNRIGPDGQVKTLLFANSMWTPCSGLFDNEGNLWLLEYSITNQCRARMILKTELTNTSAVPGSLLSNVHAMATIITGTFILIIWFLLKLVMERRRFKLQ